MISKPAKCRFPKFRRRASYIGTSRTVTGRDVLLEAESFPQRPTGEASESRALPKDVVSLHEGSCDSCPSSFRRAAAPRLSVSRLGRRGSAMWFRRFFGDAAPTEGAAATDVDPVHSSVFLVGQRFSRLRKRNEKGKQIN